MRDGRGLNNEERLSFPSNFERQWIVYGAVGLLLGTIGRYILLQLGLLDQVPWSLVAFFLFYTFFLFLVFLYCRKPASGQTVTSWGPNSLARFRSYLTFLPITHIIQHGDIKDSLRVVDSLKPQPEKLNGNELSLRISIQKDLVIQAILDEYVAPWYMKISSNTAFLQQCRTILQLVFLQFAEKIQQVDRNEFAKEAIQTMHLHWKEYCDASAKCSSSGESIIKCFKFVHPYLQDTVEVSQRYEKMICKLLEDLVIPDLQSAILCQFLSGILVKSFFLYYSELICQPSWINSSLITLLSSGTFLAELAGSSSQNSSSPATPLPDRSPKNNSGDVNSALSSPTPTPSDSSASGFTPPQKLVLEHTEDIDETRFFFGKDVLEVMSMDTRDGERNSGTPIYKGGRSPSPLTSVSSALCGVIPTTTLPLLPTGSYILDPMFGPNILKEEFREGTFNSSGINDKRPIPEEDASLSACDTLTDVFPKRPRSQGNSDASDGSSREQASSSTQFKASTPTHYHSFEEVSSRKPTHSLIDSGTLSVDGAMDGKRKSEKSNTHELKIGDGDVKYGRSPVYEEPEDFATSIAKLRSLLEQRDSKKNLNPGAGENSEVSFSFPEDFQHKETAQFSSKENETNVTDEKLNKDLILQLEDLQSPSTLDVSDEELELKCYFFNITVPKVESFSDSGGQYDLYCIKYEGVYFDEKYGDHSSKVILRNTTVKRRFKEFLLLQSKLEEHSHWKPHLKGIKAPNRWLNLSFSKADAATTRKAMLERYINQLCNHPVLGTCKEVLQFMAYGDEGFSLDPLDINDPKHLLSNRLEKLAKKFTGVLNTLKDVLPSFESNPPSPHSEIGSPHFEQPNNSIPSFHFTERPAEEDRESPTRSSTLDSSWLECLAPALSEGESNSSERRDYDLTNPNIGIGASDVPEVSSEFCATNTAYPLAAALTQFLCDVLWLPNCRPNNTSVSTFMSISGKSLENYVQETIDVCLSDEAVLGYLEWFNKSLKADTESIQESLYDYSTEIDLKNCLRRRIPAWVRWMWGRNRLDLTIERITGFFQNPIINQDLVLSLSELLFSKITQDA